jgi:DNA helicase II / ATP-dependent DNA helicase PcrA
VNGVDLEAGLNARQREAVFHPEGPLLVLAGAGSGKTRVLTHRIAYLLQSHRVAPHEVLAITFTNKAAAEMKARVMDLVGPVASIMWVSTFHAACARILRRDGQLLGYRPGFSIYDQQDQVRLVKHCLEDLKYDPKRFPPQGVHARISDAKNRLVDVDDFLAGGGGEPDAASSSSSFLEVTAAVYRLYQKRMYNANAMDFDDLLMRVVDVLRLFPHRLEQYRTGFRHVLVDEYQDTNHAQYTLVKLLSEQHQQVTVVGDDDQSVYSWRGADIRNILEFERDFPTATVIKLEQNYRSTTTILEAANAVVSNNRGRKPKHLWTERGKGEPLLIMECRDEHEEARLVAGEIQTLFKEGRSPSHIAVFYRVNAQSRVLEDILVRYGIGYQVIGGTRFYERAEIKDMLAYLRAVVNPTDDLSLLRVLNVPKRGLGNVAEGRLQLHAAAAGGGIRGVLSQAEAVEGLAPGARRACLELGRAFCRWEERAGVERSGSEQSGPVQSPATRISRVPVADQVRAVMEESGMVEALRNESTLEAEGRLENLQEFLGVTQEYDRNNPDGSLLEFLQEISLYADVDALKDREQQVTLMTLHNAKGLEFPVVFMVGMEEGIFPHSRSLDEQNLEEERRLCYVGITRAMERLYLSYALSRSLYGVGGYNMRSRFLEEIPAALVRRRSSGGEWGKTGRQGAGTAGSRPFRSSPTMAGGADASSPRGAVPRSPDADTPGGFAVGDRVHHAKFGEGLVLGVEPGGVVSVFFSGLGEQKKLLLDYAPLRRL